MLEQTHTPPEVNPTGYISGFPVSSLIQVLELEQKSCTLQVRAGTRNGFLYIHKGAVHDAKTDALDGETAATKILGWENTQIKLVNTSEKRERRIRSSLTRLILDASRQRDEMRDSTDAHDDLIQAIRLVEGNHFKQAHAQLSTYLKRNPDNAKAWLWYSRCLGSLRSISAALGKCAKLSPKDMQVVEEMRKLNRANEKVVGVRIRRCPFCWSPLELHARQCYYCKSRLVMKAALKQNTLEQVNSKFLIDAVTRYTDVVAHENNVNAVYYLCLANCNLNKADEALDLLNEASRINPDNKLLADQLNIVINHVATRLPRYEADTTTKPIKAVQPKADVTTNKKKVLIVEDSPTTRKVVMLTLKQKGYAMVEATDGLEALSKIDTERPDLVLLDIILPKMDGYRILSIIKKTPEIKDTPVILLTSKDGLINKVKGRLAGSTAYLTKPFKPKELIETVRKHIG